MVEMTLPPTPDDIALPTRPLASPLPTREKRSDRYRTPTDGRICPPETICPISMLPHPSPEEGGQHEPHVQSLKQR